MQFTEHPLRQRLNAEFHARPPIPLHSPMLVSHLVFMHDADATGDEREHLSHLCQDNVCKFLEHSDAHLLLDTGDFRMRWELHTEFSSYTFFRPLRPGETWSATATALDIVAADWLAAIPGKLLVGTHVDVRPANELSPESVLAGLAKTANSVVAAQIVDGAAWVFTDFQFQGNFTRFQLIDAGLTERQAGRTVQRLVEIETYRMLALLGLPVAKETGRWLRRAEPQLADLMDEIGKAANADDERRVLNQLSELAAEVEHSVARTAFRFGAARAYHGLVMQRIEELREQRVPGFPTFREFMDRRLLPPMNTCQAMARRQEDLSGRVARNSQLLRTRVDIELEHQNQQLLSQMNKRAKLQLRLQETVEGLSIVAITYYGSQLVQYLSKGLKPVAPWLSPEVVTALSIPLIAGLVAWGTHRMREHLAAAEAQDDEKCGKNAP